MRLLQFFLRILLLFIIVESMTMYFDSELKSFFSVADDVSYASEVAMDHHNEGLYLLVEKDSKLDYVIEKRKEYYDILLSVQEVVDVGFD